MHEIRPSEFVNYHHVQELDGLEMLKASYQHTQFSKHTHEGYCIGLIDEGAQSFLRTGNQHIAPQGDIILVNADEVHTGSSAVETGWCYRAIYPTPEMIQEVSQDFFHEAGTMPWFPQAVVHDEGLAEQLNLLFDLLLQPKNTLFKQSLYISTLAYLLSRYNQSKKILKDLEIEERVLYACRHTFGSRCIDSGITPIMTAFLMGNNPETALKNYTHQINLPKDLPII